MQRRTFGPRSWRVRLAGLFCLAVACAILAACQSVQFDGSGFGEYPPTTAFAGPWRYAAELYVETPEAGSMFNVQQKRVWVRIHDRAGKRLLDDRLDFKCRLVVGRCTWASFEDIEVRLYEIVDDGNYDYQNSNIEPRAPHGRLLTTLHYRYDASSKTFVRVQ